MNAKSINLESVILVSFFNSILRKTRLASKTAAGRALGEQGGQQLGARSDSHSSYHTVYQGTILKESGVVLHLHVGRDFAAGIRHSRLKATGDLAPVSHIRHSCHSARDEADRARETFFLCNACPMPGRRDGAWAAEH